MQKEVFLEDRLNRKCAPSAREQHPAGSRGRLSVVPFQRPGIQNASLRGRRRGHRSCLSTRISTSHALIRLAKKTKRRTDRLKKFFSGTSRV
ncbi:unnamed protein product [Larinioides sclopetarius]|uniref:Uncharacterized protein n=1 Tax=Larinioides sclopetarius TaxID=280406 RepID=A0AAV1Z3B7_9ARAC